jgi:hypothetical protein
MFVLVSSLAKSFPMSYRRVEWKKLPDQRLDRNDLYNWKLNLMEMSGDGKSLFLAFGKSIMVRTSKEWKHLGNVRRID